MQYVLTRADDQAQSRMPYVSSTDQTQISVCVLQSVTKEFLVDERFWHMGLRIA